MSVTELAKLRAQLHLAQTALSEVRRLCEMTINASVRVQAVQQAQDTLAAIDAITTGQLLPGDEA